MVKVAKTPLGFFAFSPTGEVVEKKELKGSAREVAEILESDEFENWISWLKERGYSIDERITAGEAYKLLDLSKEEIKSTRDVIIEVAKIRVKKAIKRDMLIIQAISYLEELNKIINMVFNRLREWFGYYWPEYEGDEMKDYVKAILKKQRPEDSMGVDISDEDMAMLRRMAETLDYLLKEREALEEYIEKLMEDVAPNVSAIATPKVGAMLIERAGGLDNLAKLPGSTIQVLGAEKALFKHLSKGTPSPKHGVLFQHPVINRAPRKLRGKLARSIAAKIAIAARIDAAGKPLNQKLVKEVEDRIKEVLEGEKK